MSRHTPGPWGPHRVAHAAVIAANGMLVANCGGHADNSRDQDSLIAEQEANARLIAAAPTMLVDLRACLAVCDRIVRDYGAVECGVDFSALQTRLRATIANADAQP